MDGQGDRVNRDFGSSPARTSDEAFHPLTVGIGEVAIGFTSAARNYAGEVIGPQFLLMRLRRQCIPCMFRHTLCGGPLEL